MKLKNTVRRLSKPYSTSIDGSFQIVKERKSKRSETSVTLARAQVCLRLLFPASSVSSFERQYGGADRDRTGDPLLAKQVLSQLSYSPVHGPPMNRRPVSSGAISRRSTVHDVKVVGLGRVELPTSPLSGVRSNQLSYRPVTHEPVREFGKRALTIGTVPGTAQATCVGRSQRALVLFS